MTKILIVDDNPDICDSLNLILTKSGYESDIAEDGRKAMVKASKNKPDIIISDIFMPVKDGLELIIEIKELYQDIKIIAISGGNPRVGNHMFLHAAEKFGAFCTLKKPLDMDKLLEEVKKLEKEL